MSNGTRIKQLSSADGTFLSSTFPNTHSLAAIICSRSQKQINMPFTFSHPAIVLPLTKYSGKYFSLTGLIIGSMMPDFEYFIRMKVQSNFSHTICGLFYFDLPFGILLAFAFHNLIRDSLFNNLPMLFKCRLEVFKSFHWNGYFKQHYFIVIISVLFGATTHLFWDSFTHINGYFVKIFLVLQGTFKITGHEIAIYKLLQHLSTLFGGLFIIWTFIRLQTNALIEQTINAKYWETVLLIFVVIVCLRLSFGIDKNYLGQLIVTCVSASLVALTISPIFSNPKI